jgi:hypothetical protein
LVARDEIEVALPHAGLVGELGVQVGQRHERLRGDAPVGGEDAELPAPRRDDLTRDEHEVAEIDEVLPPLERLLADLIERHHRLDARPVARLQRSETQLAGVPQMNNPPSNPDNLTGHVIGRKIRELGPNVRDRVRNRHGNRIRALASRIGILNQTRALTQPNGHLLGDVFVSRVFFSHQEINSGRWVRCR